MSSRLSPINALSTPNIVRVAKFVCSGLLCLPLLRPSFFRVPCDTSGVRSGLEWPGVRRMSRQLQ
ncbi:hypothetical protein E4U10_000427, partial [Claviceps purpurea]